LDVGGSDEFGGRFSDDVEAVGTLEVDAILPLRLWSCAIRGCSGAIAAGNEFCSISAALLLVITTFRVGHKIQSPEDEASLGLSDK
jgi:hypothetical protein